MSEYHLTPLRKFIKFFVHCFLKFLNSISNEIKKAFEAKQVK